MHKVTAKFDGAPFICLREILFSNIPCDIELRTRFLCNMKLTDFLLLQEEIYVARAPGRLDVMGGIADYSGSLVLQVSYTAKASAICFID